MADRRIEDQFTGLYRANYGRVLRFVARRTGDRGPAEDLTADTFRIAWANAREGDPISRAWLFVTAQHTLCNHHRSAHATPR